MIKTLFTGNFKAFAETQRIPIRSITLIFGPNSAGKSSFIHSLALAHEAQRTGRFDVYKTEVGGSAIDLGGFSQYIHRGEARRRFEWGAELDTASITGRLSELLAPATTVKVLLSIGVELDDEERPISGAVPRVMAYELLADDAMILRMSRRPDGSLRVDRLNHEHAILREVVRSIVLSSTTTDSLSEDDFTGIREAIDGLVPELRSTFSRLLPDGVFVLNTDANGIGAGLLFPVSKGNRREDLAGAVRLYLPRILNELVRGTSEAVASEIGTLQYLGPLRSFPPRHLAFAEHEDTNWFAGGGYAWDVVRRDDAVREAVNCWLGSNKLQTRYRLEVRSLVATQALRKPLCEAMGKEEGEEEPIGYETVAVLLRNAADAYERIPKTNRLRKEGERKQLQAFLKPWRQKFEKTSTERDRDILIAEAMNALNEWREETRTDKITEENISESEKERAIEEKADRLMDYIESSEIAGLRELVLYDLRTEAIVSHRDVGIGISQALPVLVTAFASKSKLIAMEQPEIHLHPALQTELADVFVESALGERRNRYILETHSEHLILRLLRRVREGKLQPSDICVLYIEPVKGGGSRIVELGVDEDGDFIDEWPGGFFEESYHEKFAGR